MKPRRLVSKLRRRNVHRFGTPSIVPLLSRSELLHHRSHSRIRTPLERFKFGWKEEASSGKRLRTGNAVCKGEEDLLQGGALGVQVVVRVAVLGEVMYGARQQVVGALHRRTADAYGFDQDNFIGRLPQSNEWTRHSTPLLAAQRRSEIRHYHSTIIVRVNTFVSRIRPAPLLLCATSTPTYVHTYAHQRS